MYYENWKEMVDAERTKPYYVELKRQIVEDMKTTPVYPPRPAIYRALTATPIAGVKVVIFGQDPYHGAGQADGLAFSVQPGVAIPPSLRNIIFELRQDVGDAAISQRRRHVGELADPEHFGVIDGDLSPWATRGVLLLNTALTVRQGEPGSHSRLWRLFAVEAVRAVVESSQYCVHFVLWGGHARDVFREAVGELPYQAAAWGLPDGVRGSRKLGRLVTATMSPHPSPLSAQRGFFGSRPFSLANAALTSTNGADAAVDWTLT